MSLRIFKSFLRNILRHRVFSFINIIGLAIGLASCFLIYLWIQDELSYDKFNANHDNIYRLTRVFQNGQDIFNSALTPQPLAETCKNEIPGIEYSSRYGTFVGEVLLSHENNTFYELGGAYVDDDFLRMFDFPLIRGDIENLFPNHFSVVLSETLAEKYFGDEDPLGKIIKLESFCELTITGIIKDIPQNSHLQFSFLVPFILYEKWGVDLSDWENSWNYTYVTLDKNAKILDIQKSVTEILRNNSLAKEDIILFQNLSDIYLKSRFPDDNYANLGNINYVLIFGIIAIFILVLACINFINLSIAKSLKRTKEVGLRKVIGASRFQLIKLYFSESFFITMTAFCFAIVLVELFLPSFNQFTGKTINLSFFDVKTTVGIILILLSTTVLAGYYPAFFLSRFKPVEVFRGNAAKGLSISKFRKILVLIQFTISISLIICTGIVFDQLKYIQNKELGFNKDSVIQIQSRPGLYRNYDQFKDRIIKNKSIMNVTAVSQSQTPTSINNNQIIINGKELDDTKILYNLPVELDYFKVLDIKIKSGRSFSKEFSTDEDNACLLNESAVKSLNFSDPIGKTIKFNGVDLTIIGVVQDFHSLSLHQKIQPVLFNLNKGLPVYLYVKISDYNYRETIQFIEDEWNKIVPDFPFEFTFIDQILNSFYLNENRVSKLFSCFTILAILISCLGLYGLAAFAAEVRTKEIGVRKVLGATSTSILWLLSKDFTKWVIFANFLAWGISYYAMNIWIKSFAYHTHLRSWIFLVSGLIAILIAFLAVSIQSVKAASANPIISLKYE